MINFLPPEAKSVVKREYRIRTISTWALLLAVVAIAETVLLVPTYVLLMRQSDALAIEMMQAQKSANTQGHETARAALEKAQVLAAQLDLPFAGPTASEILHAIQHAQTSAITLSGFSYAHGSTTVEKVEVRGVATTREALAEFSALLERDPLFTRAPVPVSDLAQDRDLLFTLTIALAQGHR